MSRFLVSLTVGICAFSLSIPAAKRKDPNVLKDDPRPFGLAAAKDFLKTMTVADGLEVTVFAAEPLLRNPSSIDVDEYGRVWVSDVANYGATRKAWGVLDEKGDRILILDDTDHDGAADKQTVFYQGRDIDSPYGVCVVGNKVWVGRSPDIFCFTDKNGDGVADNRELIFGDIGGFDSDHCAHTFVFGPDGKMYFNFGNHAGQMFTANKKLAVDLDGYAISVDGIKTPNKPTTKVYHHGMSFRCNPDGTEVETMAHNFRNPYEVCLDSYGTQFCSDNDDDGNRGTRVLYMMDYGNFGYTDEMTGAGWRDRRSNLETEIRKRHWHQNDPGVVPNLFYTGAGAPCGMTVYEGDLIPSLRGALLHCDPGPQEVRAYVIEPDGAGFKATQKVILKSSDTWFRPSDVCIGPDGALYVADWHDGVVGGHNIEDNSPTRMKGRIYRIAPKGAKLSNPKFDFTTAAGCAEALKSPNLAARARAWTQLAAMKDGAVTELTKLWRNKDPLVRARALYLLGQSKQFAADSLGQALVDPDPNIRMLPLRISRQNELDEVQFVRQLVKDPNPQVRRECAIALRRNTTAEAAALWAELAVQHDGKDRWYLEALGIGAAKNEDACFAAWLKVVGDKWNTPAGRDIIWRSRSGKAASYLAKIISDPATPSNERARYFRSLDFIKGPEKEAVLLDLLALSGSGRSTQ